MENTNTNSKKGNTGWFKLIISVFVMLAILVALCVLLFMCFMFSIQLVGDSNFNIGETTVEDGNSSEKIAVIEISGVITQSPVANLFEEPQLDMTTSIINKLERAKNDENVKAVILDIDSPGGEVYASELIYNKIIEVKDEGKYVISLFRSMAASGGYYIASPSDHIVASETTITGSIGVKIETQDLKGLYEKLGIETYSIVNSEGNLKIAGEDLGDSESEAYKSYQKILDDIYNQFVGVVSEGRDMTRAEVVKLADGRVYSGKNAKEIGLVDSIGYFEEAVDEAKTLINNNDATVVRYTNYDSYVSELGFKINSQLSKLNSLIPDDTKVETKILYIHNL